MADANATANGGTAAPMEAPRGMPYYEKLRRDLREALQKKRVIDASLVCVYTCFVSVYTCLQDVQQTLDESILVRETTYLEETSAGNIIKGFDNYIKGTTTSATSGGAGTTTRRKAVISDADRIFSRSSGFVKVQIACVAWPLPALHVPD